MADEFQYDKLVTLNRVYHNTIHESSFVAPITIKTKLYSHQSSLVQGMHQHREKMSRGFMI